jgi:hypothetical protein
MLSAAVNERAEIGAWRLVHHGFDFWSRASRSDLLPKVSETVYAFGDDDRMPNVREVRKPPYFRGLAFEDPPCHLALRS